MGSTPSQPAEACKLAAEQIIELRERVSRDLREKLAAERTQELDPEKVEVFIDFAVKQMLKAHNGRGIAAGEGLYPYLWNWDTAFIARWLARDRPDLSLENLESLFEGQWENGLLPHILFFEWKPGEYFPQPDYWGTTDRKVQTSSITQPPVAAMAVERLVELHGNNPVLMDRVDLLLEKVAASHEFLRRERDPQGIGAVALFNPWASGMDNAMQWRWSLTRVDGSKAAPFKRVDLEHVADPAERPSNYFYEKVSAIVTEMKRSDFKDSPFQVYDPFMTTMTIMAERSLAKVARARGRPDLAQAAEARAASLETGLEQLWSAEHGRYFWRDAITNELITTAPEFENGSGREFVIDQIASYAPLLLDRDSARHRELEQQFIDKYLNAPVPLPTVPLNHPLYQEKNYWNGPTWPVINGLFAERYSVLHEVNLFIGMELGGFEYVSAKNGKGFGSASQSWSWASQVEAAHQHKIRVGGR